MGGDIAKALRLRPDDHGPHMLDGRMTAQGGDGGNIGKADLFRPSQEIGDSLFQRVRRPRGIPLTYILCRESTGNNCGEQVFAAAWRTLKTKSKPAPPAYFDLGVKPRIWF